MNEAQPEPIRVNSLQTPLAGARGVITWSVMSTMGNSMLRNTGAIIAGFVVGNLAVYLIELMNHDSLPADLNFKDMEAFRAAIAKLPMSAFIVVLHAWAAGSFAGPFTAALLARGPRMILACVIGTFFFFATLINLILIPGPLFMWSGLVIVPISTLAGAALALKLNPSKPAGPRPYDMREKGMACK